MKVVCKFILNLTITMLLLAPRLSQAQTSFIPARSQVHFSVGMVNAGLGSSVGVAEKAFSVMPSFDVYYELFPLVDRTSILFRGTIALDMKTTVTRYLYGGIGQRRYIAGKGLPTTSQRSDLSVSMSPSLAYYIGWDFGLSESVLNVLTPSLQTVTTGIDGGGTVGALYRSSGNLGVEVALSASYVFGFSSVPASGMVMKVFLGAAYAF